MGFSGAFSLRAFLCWGCRHRAEVVEAQQRHAGLEGEDAGDAMLSSRRSGRSWLESFDNLQRGFVSF